MEEIQAFWLTLKSTRSAEVPAMAEVLDPKLRECLEADGALRRFLVRSGSAVAVQEGDFLVADDDTRKLEGMRDGNMLPIPEVRLTILVVHKVLVLIAFLCQQVSHTHESPSVNVRSCAFHPSPAMWCETDPPTQFFKRFFNLPNEYFSVRVYCYTFVKGHKKVLDILYFCKLRTVNSNIIICQLKQHLILLLKLKIFP